MDETVRHSKGQDWSATTLNYERAGPVQDENNQLMDSIVNKLEVRDESEMMVDQRRLIQSATSNFTIVAAATHVACSVRPLIDILD